jgi:hypothetical protein
VPMPRVRAASVRPFISYAREDFEFAKRLYADLRRLGAEPWMDVEELTGGTDWQAAVRHAIRESTHFLALISRSSVNKRGYVQKEVRQALELLDEFAPGDVFIVPIRIDDSRPRHEPLQRLQWIDMFGSYSVGLQQLAVALQLRARRRMSADAAKTAIRFHSVSTSYDIKDIRGKRAVVRVRQLVEAIVPHVITLVTRGIASSGLISDVRSNLGSVLLVNEGGVGTAYTNMTSPLQVGETVTHELSYEGHDCFTASRETVAQNVSHTLTKVELSVEFPAKRPARSASAHSIYEEQLRPLKNLIMEDGGRRLSLVVRRPPVGTRIVIEWEW